jgi:hypothetical protein
MGVKDVGRTRGLIDRFDASEHARHLHACMRTSRTASSDGIIATSSNIW